ncbi:hypothetical protein KQH60_08945 [Mycetohabitans sp. B8]|uniref:hypothetical protein n=1 Tax=Mycetohabitans sp. B8 TaxID=2841845 RepID=UPI001F3B9CA6|nr:hypothetical protein [Mycetohabitans sp. B8]MCG1042666.1 hypothetical protein [Mycetohabitans sp. B8]
MTITISITQSDSSYSPFGPGSPSGTYGTAPDAAHHKRAEQSDSMGRPANGTSSDDSDFLQKLIEQLLAMLQNSHSDDDDNSFDDDGTACGHRSPAPPKDGDCECPCSPHHGHSAADRSQHDGKAPVTSGGWGTITDPVTSGGLGTITDSVTSGGSGTTTHPVTSGGWGTITDPDTSGGSGTITSPASNGDSSTITHPGSSNSKDASTNSTVSADPFGSSGNSRFDPSGVVQAPAGNQFYE